MGISIGYIIGQIFGLICVSGIIAKIIQMVSKYFFKFLPPYKMVFYTLLISNLVCFIFALFFFSIAPIWTSSAEGVLIYCLFCFVITAYIYGIKIIHPKSGKIGIKKGLLLVCGQLFIGTLFIVFGFLLIVLLSKIFS